MTNRQSNIIFYSVIFAIICVLLVSYSYPQFFENLTKSKEQLTIEQATKSGAHNKALASYKKVLAQHINDNGTNTVETADLYENIANTYALLGNKEAEKEYYLKSLNIKKQLSKIKMYSFAKTYYKLGSLAQEAKDYDQAQMYYEESLSTRLGNEEEINEEDEGFFTGMQNTRFRYLRLNHRDTIITYKSLGAIHNLKKEQSIAKEYYQKALAASTITFGEDDVKTLEIMDLIKRLTTD